MVEWNKDKKPGTLGETVVVERSAGWFVVGVALWGLAGYGVYKLVTR
jgi:hypothetical protein